MDSQKNNILLQLSPEIIHAQCLFAIKQARNSSHALATLIALQTFVASTAKPSDRDTPAHKRIKDIITGHAAKLREQLLAEKIHVLTTAMREQDCAALTGTHDDLSRNGFWQAAQVAIAELDAAECAGAKTWTQAWCADAKSRALAASGYPDALNFQKAGISIKEYTAMTDLNICLQNTNEGNSRAQ